MHFTSMLFKKNFLYAVFEEKIYSWLNLLTSHVFVSFYNDYNDIHAQEKKDALVKKQANITKHKMKSITKYFNFHYTFDVYIHPLIPTKGVRIMVSV